jgi:hypothetical protein
MTAGSPPMHYRTPMPHVRITSCIQNSGYLQFDPRLLQLASLTLYRTHKLYIHLYLDITSPTERFHFLSQFYGRGFPGTRYRTLIPRVPSIHLPSETWVIYNSSTDSQVQKSTKASLILVHARHVRPFPIDINYDFTGDSSQMFENIGINKRKARGNLPLKCIYGRILWNLISFLCQS